jgi:LuxR family transcriptional regulator, quorum-sensing system regulator BjaR1
MHRLQEMIDSLLREKTPRSMLDHMHAMVLQFGIDRFVLLRFANSGETIDRWLVGFRAVNPKKVWLQRYVHRDDPNADPVVKHSKQTVEPFFWGDVLTEEEKKKRGGFVSEALVVPVPSPRGLVGMMVMAGEHADRNHLHKYKPVLQAIGLASYYHIERHCAPDPDDPAPQHAPPRLTLREQEILSLISEGLSAPLIARQLNISDRTVEWHIEKSMKKLEAKNRIQAVVLAIRDGLIPLC